MIQTSNTFSNEMQNQTKLAHLKKIISIQEWITQNIWYIGAIICIFNNKLQKIWFKYSFIWKSEKARKEFTIFFIM